MNIINQSEEDQTVEGTYSFCGSRYIAVGWYAYGQEIVKLHALCGGKFLA